MPAKSILLIATLSLSSLCSHANESEQATSLASLKRCAEMYIESRSEASFDDVALVCISELDIVFAAHNGLTKDYVLAELQDDFSEIKSK